MIPIKELLNPALIFFNKVLIAERIDSEDLTIKMQVVFSEQSTCSMNSYIVAEF